MSNSKKAVECFISNPKVDAFHQTSDGSCWTKEEQAISHARVLADKTVTSVTRESVSKEIEDFYKANGKTIKEVIKEKVDNAFDAAKQNIADKKAQADAEAANQAAIDKQNLDEQRAAAGNTSQLDDVTPPVADLRSVVSKDAAAKAAAKAAKAKTPAKGKK